VRDTFGSMAAQRDAVDAILDQWRAERPDVDVSGMAVIGRISRLERVLGVELARVFATHHLERWEFDVLATLRRSGPPFELTVGELLESMMLASGTISHRIDRLEQRGLVERRPDPADGRVVRVRLSRSGRSLVDKALVDHAANETRLLNGLSRREQDQLAALLRRLHLSVGEPPTTE
jgi:DNA-binding MarR family transcriptional regulator